VEDRRILSLKNDIDALVEAYKCDSDYYRLGCHIV